MSGNTILITGGGSGIGEALAHRWHDAGNTIVIAGRRQEVLAQAAQGRQNTHTIVADVDSADGVAAFAREALAAHPAINVLVNNAGIMRFEDASASRDLADAEATITSNLLGSIRVTGAFIDHLKGQAGAAIVNVTSGLAFVPLLTTPTCNATKAALHSYTVALRQLLKRQVEVIELVPPGVQTELTPGQAARTQYQPLDEFADEVIALFGEAPTPPEILVERVKFLRNAEAEGRYDVTVEQLNAFAAAARAEAEPA